MTTVRPTPLQSVSGQDQAAPIDLVNLGCGSLVSHVVERSAPDPRQLTENTQRDARLNIICGVLLPFALPAAVKLASGAVDPGMLAAPHLLVWVISSWALVPASMIMRGMAMLRIAGLITQKRRAACSAAEEALQTA